MQINAAPAAAQIDADAVTMNVNKIMDKKDINANLE